MPLWLKELILKPILRARRGYWDILRRLNLPGKTKYGFKWYYTADANSYFVCVYLKHPEEQDIRFVEKLLRPGDVVVDIGAHHGLYTLLAASKVKPSGKVISFEPSPRERARLLRNIAANRFQPYVQVEPYALSNQQGRTKMYIAPAEQSGLNSLRPINEPGLAEEKVIQVEVPMLTLDDYFQEKPIEHITLIKMDAEGGELPILQGADQVIRRFYPIWLIEVHENRTIPWGYPARRILDFLQDYGYQWYIAEKKHLKAFSYTADTPIPLYNYIAIHPYQYELVKRRIGSAILID